MYTYILFNIILLANIIQLINPISKNMKRFLILTFFDSYIYDLKYYKNVSRETFL